MKMNGENLEESGYDLVDKVNLDKIWKSLRRTKPQCFDPHQSFNYAHMSSEVASGFNRIWSYTSRKQ